MPYEPGPVVSINQDHIYFCDGNSPCCPPGLPTPNYSSIHIAGDSRYGLPRRGLSSGRTVLSPFKQKQNRLTSFFNQHELKTPFCKRQAGLLLSFQVANKPWNQDCSEVVSAYEPITWTQPHRRVEDNTTETIKGNVDICPSGRS